MKDKHPSSESEKSKELGNDTKTFREWAGRSAISVTITTIIGLISAVIQIIAAVQEISLAVVGVLSGVLSIAIVLYAIWFLYQRQQKQKKEIDDALHKQEQEFLAQINQDFSMLLEEKAG